MYTFQNLYLKKKKNYIQLPETDPNKYSTTLSLSFEPNPKIYFL